MHLSPLTQCAREHSSLAILAALLTLGATGCDQGSSMPSAPSACREGCQYTASSEVPPSGSPVELHGQLQVLGTELLDQNGEPVQLKGVSSMWLNWETT